MTTPAIFHAVRSPPCVGFFASSPLFPPTGILALLSMSSITPPFFTSALFTCANALSISQRIKFGASHTSSKLTLLSVLPVPLNTCKSFKSNHYHSLIHSLLSINLGVFSNTSLPKSILVNEGKSIHYSFLKQLTLKCDLHHIHKTAIVDLHNHQSFTVLHFIVDTLHLVITCIGRFTETVLSNDHSLQMRHVFETERQYMLEAIISNCQFFQHDTTGELLTAHGFMTSHSIPNRCFDCIGFEK